MATAPDSRPALSHRSTVVLLVIAAVAPFLRTLLFGYVLDEVTAIRSNPDLNGWASLARVWTHQYGSPDAPFVGLYRPFTMMLFAAIRNVGNGWPIWFHLVAIALHALATILVWRLLRRAVPAIPALIGALVFAVHPVHIEAVANVANASEVLVAIWSVLLTLHVMSSHERGDRGGRAAFVSGLLFFLALCSKESGAMAPVLAVLCLWGWDTVTRRDLPAAEAPSASRWIPGPPTLAAWVAAFIAVVALRWSVLGGPVSGRDIAAPGIDGMSMAERIWSMLSLGPLVGGLLTWPTTINPGYGPSVFAGALSLRALATLVFLACAFVVVTVAARRGDRRWMVALLWVAIAFVPASNLFVPTGQILAERTLYVSSVGIAMLVGLVAEWLAHRSRDAARGTRIALVAGALIGIVILGERTRRWTMAWSSHERVYRQMVDADPRNYRGYWSLAIFEGNNGRMPNAVKLLENAYRLYPADRGLKFDYADALFRTGRPGEAAHIAEGYLDAQEFRNRPAAIGLYVLALRQAFGADSLEAASRRMSAAGHAGFAALLAGQGLEVRGESARALDVYRNGLRAAPGDLLLQSQIARLANGS